MWLSLLCFFIISFGIGFTILSLCKTKTKDPLVRIIEVLGVGITGFSFLAVIFWLFRIPIDYRIYLLVALAYPIFSFVSSIVKKKKIKKVRLFKKEAINIGVRVAIILIVLGGFFMVYHQGAFGYPYLENDDPWVHALTTKYIATTGQFDQSEFIEKTGRVIASYLEPYPITFSAFMAVISQTNDNVSWTLKFFNILLVTLGLAFYYVFGREYWGDDWKGLFTMFVLATLPSFMSHFIWSQTLALVIFPVAFYAYLRALKEKEWIVPAAIAIGSMLVTQPVVSIFFGLAVLLCAVLILLRDVLKKPKKKMWIRALITGASGVAVSFIYWVPILVNMGLGGVSSAKGHEFTQSWRGAYALQEYTLREVLFPPHASRIDQAIGWGWVSAIILVFVLGLILYRYAKTLNLKKEWRYLHLIIWFGFLAYLVFAPSFGLPGWGSHRVWAYLSIPLALLVAEGISVIANAISKKKVVFLVVSLIILVLIGISTIPAKVAVQTAMWPPGVSWTDPQGEISGLLTMEQNLPPNTPVFPLCSEFEKTIGFGMYAEGWDAETFLFQRNITNRTGEEILSFLKSHGYQYTYIDATCVKRHGNETQDLVNKLQGHVAPVINQQGFLLVQLV